MGLEGTLKGARRFLTGALLMGAVSLGCTKIVGPPENGNGKGDPELNPPAAPSITQTIPYSEEPQRGIQLLIRDGSDNEDGFRIERKVQGGTFTSISSPPEKSGSGDNFIYNDLGLEMATRYTYRARAYNQDGNSSWSEKTQTTSGPETEYLLTYTTADTHIKETSPNTNFGDGRSLFISGEEGDWRTRAKALLKFSLPNIPSYAIDFEAAYLRLCEAGGGNTIYPGDLSIYVAPIAFNWNENTVTWNNSPPVWLPTSGHEYGYGVHNPNNDTCVWIDVSTTVSDWYSGFPLNKGFMLFSNSDAYVSYYSKEGHQPGSALLEVDYTW